MQTPSYQRNFQLLLATSCLFALLIGQASCSSKKRKKSSGGAPVEVPVEEPVVIPPSGQSTVGEPVPPITNTEVTVLETDNAPAIKHLIFQASDTIEDSRHTSEYLLVVRAAESSCIKLKVRPTDGLSNESAEEISNQQAGNEGSEEAGGGCDFTEEVDKEETAEDKAEAEPDTTPAPPAATLALFQPSNAQLSQLEFQRQPSFALANAYALCSLRLFRMPASAGDFPGITTDLGKVSSKTGRLVAISTGKKVRIWLDDEVGNACAGGTTPADLPAVDFGPVNKSLGLNSSNKLVDQLKLSQLQLLANESEAQLAKLTGTFGDVSDIDGSTAIEVFISPDVNRQYFVRHNGGVSLDSFRANYINKPQDLGLYDANKNPTSNEGEVLYLWAPDPAALYIYNESVSSNALTGNYAKGYLGSQMMNLIIHNQRLVVQKPIKPEEPWLVESLALLASGYVGGIDYTRYNLGQYMTSRPQNLSLTDGPAKDLGIEGDIHMDDETSGLRAMFGWYLHAKLCSSTTVTPCAGLIDFITSDLSGAENIEKVLALDFSVALQNFGASVGVSLIDEPAKALAFWDSGNDNLPVKPVLLPDLAEIYPSSVNKTEENQPNATGGVVANKADRTMAGAFPSKNMLIFQPILPDNEMDLELAKNSITYIILTGLIQQNSDMTVVLGKKLNVAIIPLGDRNGSLRRIHAEKQSEFAHLDLRSTNLTDLAADARKTYNKPSEYSTDYTVNALRELWIMGSIDNYTVPSAGESTATISDTDSFNIKVNPCQSSTDAACATKTQYLILQLIPRDFQSELFPMFYTTSTDLNVFAGANAWMKTTELDPGFELPSYLQDSSDIVVPILCQNADSHGLYGGANPDTCANGGVDRSDFADMYCGGDCTLAPYQSDLNSAAFFGAHNSTTSPAGFLFSYDNFFYSGPNGYPYTNVDTITFTDAPTRRSDEYYQEEIYRQFFSYKYDTQAKPYLYYVLSVDKDAETDPDTTILSEDLIRSLVSIHSRLYQAPAFTPDDAFKEHCSALGLLETLCESALNLAASDSLQSEIEDWISGSGNFGNELPKRIVCINSCPNSAHTLLTAASVEATGTIRAWFNLPAATKLNLIVMSSDPQITNNSTNSYRSFYHANQPSDKSGVCTGEADAGGPFSYGTTCSTEAEGAMATDDIRRQFNSSTERIAVSGYGQKYADYNFIGDSYAWSSYFHENVGAMGFLFQDYTDAIDRTRVLTMPIEGRRGEVIGKPLKLHPLVVEIPAATASTIHVMIGGKEGSSGKYLLRARVLIP